MGNFATATFVPVEASLPKDPAVAEVERAYNRDLGELNLAWAREHGQHCAPPSLEAPAFIGSVLCGTCHTDALAVWKGTKHPLVYAALVKEGKQHHLDCIGGSRQPGGVCRVDRTEAREEVTCESCHGPGSKHLAIPMKETIRPADSSAACVGATTTRTHLASTRALPAEVPRAGGTGCRSRMPECRARAAASQAPVMMLDEHNACDASSGAWSLTSSTAASNSGNSTRTPARGGCWWCSVGAAPARRGC